MTSPFDFLNSINFSKEKLDINDYNPFMVNRGLSYFYDTVLLANEMNRNSFVDNDIQYQFLLSSVNKKKRFSKWHKRQKPAEVVKLICEFYQISEKTAEEYLSIMKDEQIQQIQQQFYVGGKGGK